MKISIPTEAQWTVINRGKSTTTTQFSKAFTVEPTKNQALMKTLERNGDNLTTLHALLNHDPPHQLLIPINRNGVITLTLLTGVHLDPGNGLFVLGSLSNDMGIPCPVRLTRDYFTSSFTSLFYKTEVAKLNLPRVDMDVDTINRVPGADGDTESRSLEELHWPSDDVMPYIAEIQISGSNS